MRNLKPKLTAIAVACLLLAVTVAGCGSSTPTSSSTPADKASAPVKKIVLKAGNSSPEGHPYNLGLNKFKEMVEKDTKGAIEIQIFPNNALGAERALIEGMQMGTVDITLSSTGPIGQFVPQMNVVDLPFLFRDKEHAYKVLDGPIGTDLFKQFENKGFIGLAYWENGFRNITNSKREIKLPEDLKGLKIRTMENKVHMAAFKQMGADPTPMAASEIFTALQNKTIDGQENPIPIIFSYHMGEVQKYLSMTGHFYSPAPLMISKMTWDKLSNEQKEILKKAAIVGRDYERGEIQKQEAEQIDKLKAQGMIVTQVDKSKFQEATKPVYQQLEKEFPKELIDKILNTK